MEKNLCGLDLDTIKILYEQESAKLKTALLNGLPWEELGDQRQKVTELAIALHKKINSTPNPAESTDRSAKRVQR
jgi:hypothetical protein